MESPKNKRSIPRSKRLIESEESFYCFRKGEELRDLNARKYKRDYRRSFKTVARESIIRGHYNDASFEQKPVSYDDDRKKFDTHEVRTHRDFVGYDDED